MILVIVIVVLVLLVLFLMSSYNKLVRLSNKVDEGFSTMDVYLKKRFDLIPNLVETVKGYAKHEADTLSSVIAQRNMAKHQRMLWIVKIRSQMRFRVFCGGRTISGFKGQHKFYGSSKPIEEGRGGYRKFS